MPRKILTLALLIIALAGCATVKPEPGGPDYKSSLYQGRSLATFSTQLPLASSQDGEQRGDRALRDGDQDRALYEYIRALEIDDNNPGVLYKIGQIHAGRDNPAVAETAFRWVLALDAGHVGAHQELGLLLLSKREYEQARQHLTHAAQSGEQLWRAENALGVLADLDGHHAKAAQHYQTALQIQPRSAMLLNNLGYSRYLAGNWDEAIETFVRALGHDPQFERAWRNLGLVYARRGEHERALEAFQRVMDPAIAYNNLGYICLSNGQQELAERYFRHAIRISPTYYVAAHQNLAKARDLMTQRNGE